jgi:hypothetical protein
MSYNICTSRENREVLQWYSLVVRCYRLWPQFLGLKPQTVAPIGFGNNYLASGSGVVHLQRKKKTSKEQQ